MVDFPTVATVGYLKVSDSCERHMLLSPVVVYCCAGVSPRSLFIRAQPRACTQIPFLLKDPHPFRQSPFLSTKQGKSKDKLAYTSASAQPRSFGRSPFDSEKIPSFGEITLPFGEGPFCSGRSSFFLVGLVVREYRIFDSRMSGRGYLAGSLDAVAEDNCAISAEEEGVFTRSSLCPCPPWGSLVPADGAYLFRRSSLPSGISSFLSAKLTFLGNVILPFGGARRLEERDNTSFDTPERVGGEALNGS